MFLATREAGHQLVDRLRLVAGGVVIGDEIEAAARYGCADLGL